MMERVEEEDEEQEDDADLIVFMDLGLWSASQTQIQSHCSSHSEEDLQYLPDQNTLVDSQVNTTLPLKLTDN
ncbi:hypothetical protein ACOMHN_020282 [Nucella lapillus]